MAKGNKTGQIVVVGGIRGGIGKTTTAISLAVLLSERGRTAIIDMDEAGGSETWSDARGAQGGDLPQVEVFTLDREDTATSILSRAKEFQYIVVDAPARDSASQRMALALAHVVAVPFVPESLCLWSAGLVGTMISDVAKSRAAEKRPRLRVVPFLNRVSAERDTPTARSIIAEDSEGVLQPVEPFIGAYRTVADAIGQGLAPWESKVRKDVRARLREQYEAVLACVLDTATVS